MNDDGWLVNLLKNFLKIDLRKCILGVIIELLKIAINDIFSNMNIDLIPCFPDIHILQG